MGSSIFCVRVAIKIFGEALELLHLQNGYYVLTLVFYNSSLNPLIYCWKMRHVGNTAKALPHDEERLYDSFIPQKAE